MSRLEIGNEAWLMRNKGKIGRWFIYGYWAPAPWYAEPIVQGIDRVIAAQTQRPSRIEVSLWGWYLSLSIKMNKPYHEDNQHLLDLLGEYIVEDVPRIFGQ